ncbi:MlaD family protein [Paraconexibacter antarcticus]|uniref:MlaD family protein n=1 Tax=Paraconexibacter antarcticus TaxID=2949664 RepID=A0ABY5DZC0_9ACTN|nr:MlaD family protein [Paraconexibacter antarcticus]UTI66187.1 MlaD family protein [Paraconexibacter antarcticus]
MNKRALTPARLGTMVIFALSCFGLLLFLWISFGGTTPLQPKGFRFTVPFRDVGLLSTQADVRISGISVGKVIRIDRVGREAHAEIGLDAPFAPPPDDIRAILRKKTLLGETYLELTPGTPGAPRLAEGGMLPRARVESTVEIDRLLSALDRPTRAHLGAWLRSWSRAVRGRGPDISAATATLPPTVEAADDLLTVLDGQRRSMRGLVRDSGTVFAAVGDRNSRVGELVTAADRVLTTTAARPRDLEATVRVLPGFLRDLRGGLASAERVGNALGPVVRDARPAAPALAPTLAAATAVAPELRSASRALGGLVAPADHALPQLVPVLAAARPLVRELHPLARELAPLAGILPAYRRELVSSWPKMVAATQARQRDAGTGRPVHYLRIVLPLWNEALAGFRQRPPSARTAPYLRPGGLGDLAQGLKAYSCSNVHNPTTVPLIGTAPPCVEQGPVELQGRPEYFPQLRRAPP